MSTENKPMTAEEMYNETSLFGVHDEVVSLMEVFAAQQTAEKDARIKELEAEDEDNYTTIRGLRKEIEELSTELEAVKKERDKLLFSVNSAMDLHTEKVKKIIDIQAQRDALKKQLEKAVDLLNASNRVFNEVYDFLNRSERVALMNNEQFLASLQTTGQDVRYVDCPDCIAKGKDPEGMTIDGIHMYCSTCDGSGQIVNTSTNDTTAKEVGSDWSQEMGEKVT